MARGRYAFLDLAAGAFAWKRDEPEVVAVNTATLLPKVRELTRLRRSPSRCASDSCTR